MRGTFLRLLSQQRHLFSQKHHPPIMATLQQKFTLSELRHPSNPIQPGPSCTLADMGPTPDNLAVCDRTDPGRPHGIASFTRDPEAFYVGTDVGKIMFEPAYLNAGPAGQYYNAKNTGGWTHYSNRRDAPWNVGGFHKAIIDTEQPASDWNLSVKLVEYGEYGRRTSKAFLARPDHKFSSLPPGDVDDECRGHLFAADLHLPDGRVRISDCLYDNGQVATETGIGDGLYPITLSRDAQGKIDLITVNFFP